MPDLTLDEIMEQWREGVDVHFASIHFPTLVTAIERLREDGARLTKTGEALADAVDDIVACSPQEIAEALYVGALDDFDAALRAHAALKEDA